MAHAVTSYTMSFYNKLEHREGGMEGKSLHLHSASEQNEALEQSIFLWTTYMEERSGAPY